MCIHSLLLFFFFIAQFTTADDRSVCNSQSIHRCICVANKNNSTDYPLCTDLIIIDHPIDTLQIEFYNNNRCSPFDEQDRFRRKLAEWISQECSSALLNCRYRLTIDNVLILGINCSTTSQFSYINLVVTIGTIDRQLAPNHLLDARIIGEVVKTRQHLMPLLIGADLHSITIERIYSTARVTTVVWWNDTAMAILVFYIAIVSSIICIKCCYHPRYTVTDINFIEYHRLDYANFDQI